MPRRRYDFPSPWWDNISPEGKALVGKMLTLDPKKRATATSVKHDEWMRNTNAAPLTEAKTALKKYNASRQIYQRHRPPAARRAFRRASRSRA